VAGLCLSAQPLAYQLVNGRVIGTVYPQNLENRPVSPLGWDVQMFAK